MSATTKERTMKANEKMSYQPLTPSEVPMFASLCALSTLIVSSNVNALRGQLACTPILFGEFSRYSLYAVHVRIGDRVMWMVSDAETTCPLTGLPEVVRQGWTPAETLRGLEADFARA